MFTPKITIIRHKAGLYEWQTSFDHEVIDSDVGDNSIIGCLDSAANSIPDSQSLVEISYRGVHMGTYNIETVRECSGDIADRITEMYGALVASRS
jgi:hypothetical protein